MNRFGFAFLAVPPLFATVGCSGTGGTGEDVGSTGEAIASATSNNETAFDYFVTQGLSYDQAAAIVGNFDQESNMDPTISQFGGGPGRGIAQWSAGGRWDTDTDDNVLWYAAKRGESPYSLNLQLEFTWYELTTFSGYGLSTLRSARNVTNATVAFQNDFEGCGTCDETNRIAYADDALNAYGHSVIGLDGKCLDVLGYNSANGAKIDLYECNGGGNQAWTLESNGNLTALGKCLDVRGGGKTNGTPVQLWACNGNPQQVWKHQSNGTLLNPSSGRCLDVPAFNTANGTELDIWDCKTSGNSNEVWHLQ